MRCATSRVACSSTASSRTRSRSTSTRSADGTLCYVAAVMQHVEEAGVHSGDSACALPAPSLDPAMYFEVCHVVRRLARGLGVVGLLNVQLAVAGGDLYVLEANPRASRTVPFASKATGVNLVEAACRLAAGARSRSSELPPERPPAQVSVKAAVLPFARFPGADPVLGPEMRSTGEVMASARDFPTAFAKAERAAGRPAAATRHGVPLGTRRRQARARSRSPRRLRASASSSSRPAARLSALRNAGLDVERDREGQAGRRPDPQERGSISSSTRRRAGTRARTATRSARRRSRARPVHHDARRAPPPRCTRSRRRGGAGAVAAGADRRRGGRCFSGHGRNHGCLLRRLQTGASPRPQSAAYHRYAASLRPCAAWFSRGGAGTRSRP